jgi:hypothetical protein
VTWRKLTREDLVLQPGDDALCQGRGHLAPNSAVSLVSERI